MTRLTTPDSYAQLDAQREMLDMLRERSDGDESVWTVCAPREVADAPPSDWRAPYPAENMKLSTRAWRPRPLTPHTRSW